MYEGYRFNHIEEIVLYAIAENRKPITQGEIHKNLHEINSKTINLTLKKLQKENLIKLTKGKKEDNLVVLNTGKIAMEKIKKMLGEHFENNWELDWKNATKI